tara:strand:+ start:4341 stop:4784 length:444 start_codon:yes stop_codon:yes gene_type:complete
MFEGSPLIDKSCQPFLAYCGHRASLNLHPTSVKTFLHFNFNNLEAIFSYEIKICRFDSRLFSSDLDVNFAFMVETWLKSDNLSEEPFRDANIFFEKNFEDLVEYSIILPRMFKSHHRYIFDMEQDSECSFGDFAKKVNLWKKSNGLS